MLVLTRKQREEIRIGDDITITILRVKGQSVRVGVEAPRQVKVLRAELPVSDHDERGPAGPIRTAAPRPNPPRDETMEIAGRSHAELRPEAAQSRSNPVGSGQRAAGCSTLARLAARCRQQSRLP